MKLCKLIFNKFAYKKDIYFRFKLSINEIFVKKMKNNQLSIPGSLLEFNS